MDMRYRFFHKCRRTALSFAACLLACCLFGCSLPASAQTTREKLEAAQEAASQTQGAIDENQKAIDSAKSTKSALEGQLGELNDQLTRVTQSLNDLDSQIQDRQQSITDTQTQLDAANAALSEAQSDLADTQNALAAANETLQSVSAEITQTESDLAAAKQQQADQYDAMKAQIRFLYEKGNGYYLEILLQAEDFADLLNKQRYIQKLYEYDSKKLAEYTETAKQIVEKQQELEQEQQEIEDRKAEIEQQQEAITQKTAEIQTTQSEISAKQSSLTSQQQELLSLQSDQQAKQSEVSALVNQTADSLDTASTNLDAAESSADALQAKLDAQNSEISELQKQLEEEQRLQALSDASTWQSLSGVTIVDSDRYLLANLIYCEAGGEPYEGQVAVGAVVMNRVMSGAFPNTISGVIYQTNQFSPVASGRLALALARNDATDSCYQAADAAMAGQSPVGSCLFFRTPVDGLTPKYTIGGHIFY